MLPKFNPCGFLNIGLAAAHYATLIIICCRGCAPSFEHIHPFKLRVMLALKKQSRMGKRRNIYNGFLSASFAFDRQVFDFCGGKQPKNCVFAA